MSQHVKYQNLDSISTNVTRLTTNGTAVPASAAGFDDTMDQTPCTVNDSRIMNKRNLKSYQKKI